MINNEILKLSGIIFESVDPEELDEVYSDYKKAVNMSYSQLKAWGETECSKKASVNSGPIRRNLELLDTNKDSWTNKHIAWAKKTIAFISRMKEVEQGDHVSKECPYSKRDISLRNWAYKP